jgi:hypothetical protein
MEREKEQKKLIKKAASNNNYSTEELYGIEDQKLVSKSDNIQVKASLPVIKNLQEQSRKQSVVQSKFNSKAQLGSSLPTALSPFNFEKDTPLELLCKIKI